MASAIDANSYDFLFKLLLVGEADVGKSSILLRFTDDTFSEEQTSTIGVDFKVKMMNANSGKRVKVTIWDTAGQERFRTLTSSYYRGAHGVILVYDVTKRETFEALGQLLEEIDVYTPGGGGNVVKLLVGNKIDLDDRSVSRKEGEAWAKQRGMLFIETSAKTKVGIKQVFSEIVEKIMERPELLSSTSSSGSRKTNIVLSNSSNDNNNEENPCGCF
uniref:Ras-related protein Rab-18 n=1 Tax=Aplanochytrium stocchinoi TaxID=215587 RepID=A0A7S3LKV3_9STRA|mmetsp:Transcript_18815/g.22952  ORF Transcript_18815/g.22952 Transcript_18815/m.22952 type:complete len:217 (-) Transcript_18815:314-964(-)